MYMLENFYTHGLYFRKSIFCLFVEFQELE